MRKMFSENQIKNIVNKSDLTPNTVDQKIPNWSVENAFDEPTTFDENLEYHKIYSRFEKINGVVYIVLLCEVTNSTDSSVNANLKFEVTLDEEIANQIYDFAGKTAHESSSSNICSDYGFYGTGTELASAKVFTLRNTSTENLIQFLNASATAVPANSTIRFSFRSFLTLI